jgi:hypothetical protein
MAVEEVMTPSPRTGSLLSAQQNVFTCHSMPNCGIVVSTNVREILVAYGLYTYLKLLPLCQNRLHLLKTSCRGTWCVSTNIPEGIDTVVFRVFYRTLVCVCMSSQRHVPEECKLLLRNRVLLCNSVY